MDWTCRGGLAAILALAIAGCSEDPTTHGARAQSPVAGHRGQPPRAANRGAFEAVSARVDLRTPAFTAPCDISNPLFPVSELDRAVFAGLVEGERLRIETTRLPGTRTIVVDGEPIETVVSQHVAWLNRRIHQVAIDWYAEDDEGNVWYLGEDVFNYQNGVLVDMAGSWLAGADGPPAMVMPREPRVGNVWRSENAVPIVFEEVRSIETGATVKGPQGPVGGAVIVRELRMDGGRESKSFAPGYGEFFAGLGQDFEALAVAVPADALSGGVPQTLDALSEGAERMFALATDGGWWRVSALLNAMTQDWRDYEATGVPRRLADPMNAALESLEAAIRARDRAEARQASVDVGLAALDFELRYEDRARVDIELIEIWTRQLRIDQQKEDRPGVLSDLETIRAIQARLDDRLAWNMHADLTALGSAALAGNTTRLEEAAGRIAGGAVRR